MACASAPQCSSYKYDFYITSCQGNINWIKSTCYHLESPSSGLKGVFEERNKIGGISKIELTQYFINYSKKVIIGFDKPNQREKFKSLDTLEDIFGKNDPNEPYRLIPVKLHEDSTVPEFLRQCHVLEGWRENFLDQLEESVRFVGKLCRRTKGQATICRERREAHSAGTRPKDVCMNQKTARESKSVGMTTKQQDVLRRHMAAFARDLPARKVLDHLSDVFTLEDESKIMNSSLPDYDKRRKLIDILMTKGPGAFDKFVNVLKKVCSHLAKPLIPEMKSDKDVTSAMKNMKLK